MHVWILQRYPHANRTDTVSAEWHATNQNSRSYARPQKQAAGASPSGPAEPRRILGKTAQMRINFFLLLVHSILYTVHNEICVNNPQGIVDSFGQLLDSALVNDNNPYTPCRPRSTIERYLKIAFLPKDAAHHLLKSKIGDYSGPDSLLPTSS